MKFSQLIYFLVTAGMFCVSNTANSVEAGHGKVSIGGEIHESACSIHTDDVWQEIPFGTVKHRDILNSSVNISKPVNIRLVNCSLERKNSNNWRNVVITFDGSHDQNSPDLFSVRGSASGVGLLISDEHGHISVPGEEFPAIQLNDGNNELHYRMNLVNNGGVITEGDWSSVIRFVVAYQ